MSVRACSHDIGIHEGEEGVNKPPSKSLQSVHRLDRLLMANMRQYTNSQRISLPSFRVHAFGSNKPFKEITSLMVMVNLRGYWNKNQRSIGGCLVVNKPKAKSKELRSWRMKGERMIV